MTWEEKIMAVMAVSCAILVVVLIVLLIALPSYCFFGDIESPRYQYLCGHSIDLK